MIENKEAEVMHAFGQRTWINFLRKYGLAIYLERYCPYCFRLEYYQQDIKNWREDTTRDGREILKIIKERELTEGETI